MLCKLCGRDIPASSGLCPHCAATGSFTATGLLPSQPSLSTENLAAESISFNDQATWVSAAGTLDQTLGEPSAPLYRPQAPEGGPLSPGQDFGSRYHIIRLLGIGGMGAVYQAWDAELGVAVAIKVIRPEAMSDPTAASEIERRFKRELLLARQVTHKNVVRIHDLGEIDGIKYITMPYVNGADLATILKRDGHLPIQKVLRIAGPIVSGLVAAHKAGVVHRDLKPANIMIDVDGDAMIMDFGIARSTGGPGTENLPSGIRPPAGRGVQRPADGTMVGTVVGTVEYMAPEQARGEPVDQRADIYAFGLILYDMLVGRRRAEHAVSAVAELKRRMEQAPPSLKSIAPALPDALDALVARCLEPDPAKRFQTTEELAADLARLDENGEPIPIRRVVGLPFVSAVVVVLLLISAGTWWYTRQSLPPPAHEPVSVLIADFQNGTNDPAFDRTLEPMLKRGLEGAGFITAYDRSGVSRTLGVRPPENMDEAAARELAVKQGLGIILSGALDRQGNGYRISIKATETVSGNVIASADDRASDKDQVLPTAMELVTAVRKSLGDDTSESAQLFAMRTLSATSLDVVRHYAAALDATGSNQFEEARESFLKALELDPKFGIAYIGLAGVSVNLGRTQDAEAYTKEALRYLDGMTERERYMARASFFRRTGDYQQCVKEYGELIVRYDADVLARNQRALCMTYLRDVRGAVDEMRRVVEILPQQVLFRTNLALYSSYAGDFQTGEEEARKLPPSDVYGALALAFAQLGQGQLPQAIETYQKLGGFNSRGASMAASGLGDVAAFEGRFSDAIRILQQGAAADLSAKSPDSAAAKFAALAYAHLLRGQKRAAAEASDQALLNSKNVKIRFLAARLLVEADEIAKARPLIGGLASETQAEPQAYAKIVEGNALLKAGDARQAITVLVEANGLLDTWIGHFDLGRAYLEAGQFAQADSEFDRAIKRRGEAISLFLNEEPTYAYLPQVYYYQGRVREALKTAGFAESYQAYLDIRGKSNEDPLVPEVRRRAGR